MLRKSISLRALSGKLLAPRLTCSIQKAGLKATYGEKYPYSEPFPYQKKKYDLWNSIFDQTMHRFNENTKIIVVEGNIGVGKEEFARKLAEGFDLKFVEPISHDKCFKEPTYGMDMRSLNPIFPPNCRFYDLNDFYNDPHPEKGTAGKLAIQWFDEKFYDYVRSLKHLLNTGQGLVMTTSVFSDMVYVDALRRLGWCSKEFLAYYNDYRSNSLCELFKPHLTIYLDAALPVVKERIALNKPNFKDTCNLNDTYLQSIEDSYRQLYLPFARKYGEVVEIDWNEKANKVDMDTIIEELQLVKLETEDLDNIKFEDWNRCNDYDYLKLRQMVDTSDNVDWLLQREDPDECPELTPTADERLFLDRIHNEHPVLRGVPHGFATEFGHNPTFKFN